MLRWNRGFIVCAPGRFHIASPHRACYDGNPQLEISVLNKRRTGWEVVVKELLTSETAATALSFIAFFLCSTIIAVGCTVAVQWRKARESELAAGLQKEIVKP